MIRTAAALLAAALATAAVGASANPFVQDKAQVRLADLDLATLAGQRSLAIRLQNAADAVCGGAEVATIHLALGAQARECREAVIADAKARIDGRKAATGAAMP